jgi:hypothetical protein
MLKPQAKSFIRFYPQLSAFILSKTKPLKIFFDGIRADKI